MNEKTSEEKAAENESRPEDTPENGNAAIESDQAKPSAEEQMAQFEEALKNDDWGHQPC